MTPRQIKNLRLKHGYTQAEIATATGYSVYSIQKMEQGKQTITERFVIALRGVFKTENDG